jgi:lipoate-protein ligase A
MTIVRYEHLHETLKGLKRDGIKYYAGCCCEAFYNKHKQDFEKVDLGHGKGKRY